MGFYDDFDQIISSPNFGGSGGRVVAICIHDEEFPERDFSDIDVGNFFSRASTGASTNGVHSRVSSTGCVPYGEASWHSGAGSPWNKMIEAYEHDGYAHQTRSEWLDEYGIGLLENSAAHTAKRCRELGLPIRWLTPEQLAYAIQTGNPADGGICDHWCITRAAKVRGGHTDCGPHFPSDYYIERVQAHYDGTAGDVPAPQVPQPVVHPSNSGPIPVWSGFSEQTKVVQQLLNELGFNAGAEDGVFGPNTSNAVMAFQRAALDTDGNRLVVDGIVGPKTFASLQICVYLKRIGDTTPPAPVTDDIPPLPYLLSVGRMRDPYVKQAQFRLRARGWNITVDGSFGQETHNIVARFQQEKGLGVDGVIGPDTWRELFRTDNVT